MSTAIAAVILKRTINATRFIYFLYQVLQIALSPALVLYLLYRGLRDPRYFTFLADCPADVTVVLGDARLSLQRAPDGQFGVLILDAYNSDSLPMHLITREALALYLRKLAPDGVLAFHISTRHLDLKSVLANLAVDAHLYALHMNDFTGNSGLAQGRFSSRWLVMTRTPASVESLLATGYWQPPRPQSAVGVWTDDHASPLMPNATRIFSAYGEVS